GAVETTKGKTMDTGSKSRIAAARERLLRMRALPYSRSVLAAIAFALLAGGGYYAWHNWAAAADSKARLATATVQRGDIEDSVTPTGTLQPRDYVDVGTQVSGQLKKLYVEIGSTVKAGQLLAEIDPTVYLSRVDADRAQLLNQQAQLADR